MTVKVTANLDQASATARAMSVTLINIFEVPAGDEDEFIAAWEKTRDDNRRRRTQDLTPGRG